MRGILLVFCLAVSIHHAFAGGCPFSQALNNGQLRAQIIAQTKDQLVKEKYLLTPGQPASAIWNTSPLNADSRDLFNRSNTLLIAKQFCVQQYLQENPGVKLTNCGRAELLRNVTSTIPLEARCTADPSCDATYKYLTTGGKCNNQQNPKWGSAGSAYSRLVKPNYDDAVYTIRRSVSNAALPSPRYIGNRIIADADLVTDQSPMNVNYASVMFGQLLAHDTTARRVYQNEAGGPGLSCCPRDGKGMPPDQLTYYGCDPIEIPSDDPYYKPFGISCMSYIRTQPTLANDCSVDSTEFINSVSHYMDLSVIYGSDDALAKAVRANVGGRLAIENGVSAKLPGCTGSFCYFTADARAMPNPTLGLVHSVFIRYHNWIADRLAASHPQWAQQDELLFQESRRIVTAVYQNIVFNEWFPLFVGRATAGRRQVSCWNDGYCGRYNASVDLSTLNEFAVGVFRLYHKLIPAQTNFYDKDYNLLRSVKLNDSMAGSKILETEYLTTLRGLLKDPAYSAGYPDNIRHDIFNAGNANGIGLDLLAVDIARGRDQGLSPYVVYLKQATNGKLDAQDWSDLRGTISDVNLRVLQDTYESVLDMDLLVGLIFEKASRGLFTGLVGQYLMEEQFYRYKFGDRFFYSLENSANPFTEAQIQAINGQKLANILCTVTDIDDVFARSFEVRTPVNRRVPCKSLPQLNLDLWK